MFNLLPESLKEGIITEYRLRKITLILIFVFFIEIVFGVFMLPSWILSYSKEKEIILRVEKMESSPITNVVNSIKPTIRGINSDLILIDKSLNYPKAIPIFDYVISKKGSSIHISNFAYTNTSTTTSSVVITGVSNTRDSLVKFKKDLEDEKLFKSVDVPISNYAKDKNIEFTMTITSVIKI